LIPAGFDYVRAGSVEEALQALADPEAKAIAGGHSLVPMMKLRLARPTRLVDIGRLDLRGIREDGDEIRIGALTTHAELARSPLLRGAVAEAASHVGDWQVRNAGTIGGSVAHGDPASDAPAALLALGARLRLRGLSGEREVAAADFFRGAFTTALEQQELVLELVVPRGAGSAYTSFEDPASGYPLAGAAAVVRDGETAIGVTGATYRPFRVDSLEALDGALGEAGVVDDARFDAEYRRHLVAVVARRAVELARERGSR
jgi:carbon-monoxide dehydrogenase medium subunit